jgi:hypothetical protein
MIGVSAVRQRGRDAEDIARRGVFQQFRVPVP